MKGSIFREGEDTSFLFTKLYLRYLIAEFINKNNGSADINSILELVKKISVNVNFSQLKGFLHSSFYFKKNVCKLHDEYLNALNNVEKISYIYYQLKEKSKDTILEMLSTYISETSVNTLIGASIFLMLKEKCINNYEFYKALLFNLLLNYNSSFIKADTILTTILKNNFSVPLYYVFNDDEILKVFSLNGLNKVEDLTNLSISSLLVFLSFNLEYNLNYLEQLCPNSDSSFAETIESIFSNLKDNEKIVIEKRFGINTKPSTLEGIGNSLKLTRERVRQIEIQSLRKLQSKIDNVEVYINVLFFKISQIKKRNYVFYDEIKQYLNDDTYLPYLLLLLHINKGKIKYDYEFNLAFDSLKANVEEIKNEIVGKYGICIKNSDYDNATLTEKCVINSCYRNYKNYFYIKIGFTFTNILYEVIDEVFPNGFKIGNELSYAKLKAEIFAKYGIMNEFPSCRSVSATISRGNYCLINRGLYKNRDFCNRIDNELVLKILEFISKSGPMCFYATIFNEFKNELQNLGVDNVFYLKGLLDPLLPAEIKTKRDYLTLKNNFLSSKDSMLNFMKGFDGSFSLDNLKIKFPGVKNYVFTFLFYKEAANGLIYLGHNEYIYFDKLKIDNETLRELKIFIINCFKSLSLEILGCKKIYSRLSILNSNLKNKLNYINNSFRLFSLISYCFKNDFRVRRPFVSIGDSEILSSYDLIKNFANKKDFFNHKIILDYISKTRITTLYSYLEFMEENSDNYVQINIDTMVKKDIFNINQDDLIQIGKTLNSFFVHFSAINTCDFEGYAMFPILRYPRNKYLLVGIIRSYFTDEFQVEDTENTYDKTDFIIRRLNNDAR